VTRGFDAGLTEIVAVVHAGNDASMAVCGRLGMEPTGRTDAWYGVELESFRLARPA
jgi:RimJ/RimL family protein N-acetyltransferase